jgi:hypothetical protein
MRITKNIGTVCIFDVPLHEGMAAGNQLRGAVAMGNPQRLALGGVFAARTLLPGFYAST